MVRRIAAAILPDRSIIRETGAVDMRVAKPLTVICAMIFSGAAISAEADVARDSRAQNAAASPADAKASPADAKKIAPADSREKAPAAGKDAAAAGKDAKAAQVQNVPAAIPAQAGAIVAGARSVPGARPMNDASPVVASTSAPSGGNAKPATSCKDAPKDGIYLKTLPDGSVELSNVPESGQYDQMAIDSPCGTAASTEQQSRVPTMATSGSDAAGNEWPNHDDADTRPTKNDDSQDRVPPPIIGFLPPGTDPGKGPKNPVPGDPPHNPSPGPSPDPTPSPQPQQKITCNRITGLVQSNPVYAGSTCNPTDPVVAAGAARGRLALLAGGNPALSRRYLMMDKAMYQQVVLGGVSAQSAQSACAPGASSATSAAPSQAETQTFDGSQCPVGWVPAS